MVAELTDCRRRPTGPAVCSSRRLKHPSGPPLSDKRSTAQVDLAVACGAEAGHFSVFFRGRFRSCVFHPDTLCQGYPNRPAHLFIRCFSRLPASLTADIDGCQDLVTALQQAVRKKIENDRLHAWLLGPLTRTLVRLAARMIAPRRSTACIDVFAMLVRLRGL